MRDKMIKKIVIILIFTLFSIIILSFTGCIEENTVEYEITFNALWSEETHPDNFPSNPHFSGLIGASHNDQVYFWKEGEIASAGIKSMAETGSKNPLNEEISKAILEKNALSLISGSGINPSPGSTSITFKVNENFPLVSLVTMIAPNPDLFVGVDSLNLYENGSFVDEKTIILYAYDAGTDNGMNYTSPDNPTNPPISIFLIEGYPFIYENELVPIGTFNFNKLE
jgi:hypothetical protein